MNIDKVGQKAVDYIQKPQAVGEKAQSVGNKGTKKPARDEVSISESARQMQEAQKAVQGAPDVREAKVAAIKKQVQDGTYNVSTEALVGKLMSLFKGG